MSRGAIRSRQPGSFAALLVCLFVSADHGRAQNAQQPRAIFRTGIELVQIDVVVVDERGNHVRGLTAADFAIRDHGRGQTIAAFDEIAHARPAGVSLSGQPPLPLDVATNQTGASERLIVVVVDDLHIWRGRTDTARQIARGILDELGGDASMAVLFTSGEHSTHVTADRALLRSAISSLEGRQSVRRPNQAVDTQRPQGIDPEASSEVAVAAVQRSQSTNLQQFADNMSLYTTVEEAARLMGAGDARRKAFVLISEGIARNPTGIFGSMSETPQAPQGGSEYGATGDASATMVAPVVTYHDLALVDMMEAMRRSNVATYAIDPRGEITSQELALELHPAPLSGDPIFRWNNPLRQAQDGLTTIAEASGGFAVVNTDDFTTGLDRIVEDLDHYYLIGFYPEDMSGKEYRPLDVRVPAHPEWKVRFRHGYRPGGARKPPADVNPMVTLSSGALPSTGLALRLGAVPLAMGSGGKTRVALALELSAPREVLEDADGRLRDEVTYEILAIDARQARVTRAGGLSARVTLSRARGESPAIARYQVIDTIALTPGAYQLRVAARSARLEKGGSVYLHVEVPDFSGDATIGGIAFAYADGARVASAGASRASGLPFSPTLDRIFAASDALRLYFEVGADGRPAGGAGGHLEIVSAGNDQVRGRIAFTADDQGRVDLTLPPGSLPSGSYLLRASLSGDGDVARSVAFAIR